MGNTSSARHSHKGSSETISTLRAKSETGSYLIKVVGYNSLTKGIGIGEFICSDVFTVGGYRWQIKFYPAGETIENEKFIGLFLELQSAATDVKAKYAFTILRQNNVFSHISRTAPVRNFNDTDNISWGYSKFVERSKFEDSKSLKNDAFTIKCTITLVNLKATTTYSITAPPSNLSRHFVHLLESGHGSDVTFVVKGEEFKAHRCVLAARSAVFSAKLLGCMKDVDRKKTITIHDIEPETFKSMLYFVYSDSLPYFKKQDLRLMAQHLLIAADR
ncbi:hypothetical protein LUZ61_007246 [Rhynchospora tenuis]|uniref:Uncharacterized protein n=1 Tax=Rhynchospora tenuis TaxID=198213 RepID=A0AAD6EWC4_9POAL|nr:hypothetical protein LUZ61_007246 [Rhynchospora tenuis]